MNNSINSRIALLKQDLTSKLAPSFNSHGWSYKIIREIVPNDILIIGLEKRGQLRKIAFLYTTAIDNHVYKSLDNEVDIFISNNSIYLPESYAYGIKKSLIPSNSINDILLQWDSEMPEFNDVECIHPPSTDVRIKKIGRVMSENPIEQIWARIASLQSKTVAKNILEIKYHENSLEHIALKNKADGISFSIQNACDFFRRYQSDNLTQRVLNLYYGSVSFINAEILANSKTDNTLESIESVTKFGHGLYTCDTSNNIDAEILADSKTDNTLESIESVTKSIDGLIIGVLRSGLFPNWLNKSRQHDTSKFPNSKPRGNEYFKETPNAFFYNLPTLFARIPELSTIFYTIFPHIEQMNVKAYYDTRANNVRGSHKDQASDTIPNNKTQILLHDWTNTISYDTLKKLNGSFTHHERIHHEDFGHCFKVLLHHETSFWHETLNIHKSPFYGSALIVPVLGKVDDWEVIAVMILYALSILVRYRPSTWRQIMYGDLDHYKSLIEEFCSICERILPEIFFSKITGIAIRADQPGSFNADL